MRRPATHGSSPLMAPQGLGVMEGYAAYERTGVSEQKQSGTPAPYGFSLGHIAANSVWSEIPSSLDLRAVGLFTCWAKRTGDMSWQPLSQAPESDTAVYAFSDAGVVHAQRLAFGNPLPFVAVLTSVPIAGAHLDSMWSGTAYEAYETEAVYRQDDAKSVPTIYFLNWGLRMESAEVPRRVRSLDAAAASVGGQLVFGVQVPTTHEDRAFPVTSFDSALTTQLALAAGAAEERQAPRAAIMRAPQAARPMGAVSTPRAVPAWAGPAAIGVGLAGLTFFFMRKR